MDLGQKLKNIRISHNYSMEELKNKLNDKYDLQISKSMISRWENGKSEPINTYLSAYAKEFGLDLNELLDIEIDTDASLNTKMKLEKSVLDKDRLELLNNYNKSNKQGKEIILDTSRNISKAYPLVSRQEMIDYLREIPLAAYDGDININTATDEELYNLYKIIKEDDE
jgi:transcriptional regulator with XRE-family HTH domain